MKTLILSVCSILSADAAPQSTPQAAASSTAPRASADAQRTLKLIDLRDLLKRDAESTTFGVYTVSGRSKAAFTPKEAAAAAAPPPSTRSDDPEGLGKMANAWQEMLAHWIPPALITPQDTLQVTRDGTVIANLTAEAHGWLEQFLALQREPKWMLDLQVDVITGPRGAFDRYLEKGSPCILGADAANQLLAEAKPGGALKRLSQPLVGWVRALNQTSLLKRSSYVKDWTIATVEPGHQKIAVPEIDTVEDGHAVSLRAVPLDATHVGLELDAIRSTLTQPIATKKVKLAIDGGREVEIALPEVAKVGLRERISLEYGGSALFSGMSDNEGTVAVVVHVERRKDNAPAVFQEVITSGKKK